MIIWNKNIQFNPKEGGRRRKDDQGTVLYTDNE